jgi:predicted metal-dependent enzyme (double-stranded beta helix superfamily)
MNAVREPSAPDRAALEALERPRGRDLSTAELRAYVTTLANRPELWIDSVRHDPVQRHYEELVCGRHLTAWLICWMDTHDTGFHDHDRSAGAVAVVRGSICEERLTVGCRHRQHLYGAGDLFEFSPADIHRIRHAGSGPAVTLHAYSPPLQRMGSYFIRADGALARNPLSPADELRPLGRPQAGRTGSEPEQLVVGQALA